MAKRSEGAECGSQAEDPSLEDNPFFECYSCKAKLCIECRTSCDRCGAMGCENHVATVEHEVQLCCACRKPAKAAATKADPYNPPHRACVDRWMDWEVTRAARNSSVIAAFEETKGERCAVIWRAEGKVGSKRPMKVDMGKRSRSDGHPLMIGLDERIAAMIPAKERVIAVVLNEVMLDMSFVRWKTLPAV